MATSLTQLIAKHSNPIFLASIGIGFVAPWVENAPQDTVAVLLAITIFLGCMRVSAEHVREVRPATAIWFLAFRYLLAPVVVFFGSTWLGEDMAVIALLLTLAPSGVVAPAMTGLLQGNVAFSLVVTLASHLIFILAAPLLFGVLIGKSISIDSVSLLVRLCAMIVAPVIMFLILRRAVPAWIQRAKNYAASGSIMLIALVIVLVIAKVKHVFFDSPSFLVGGFVWVSVVYALGYWVLGWASGWRQPFGIRNAMAISSGANNVALVVVLAMLYFSPKVQILAVIAEIVWTFGLLAYRMFLSHQTRVRET